VAEATVQLNETILGYEFTPESLGKGAPHGFHRHTTPNVYRPEAAKDAFQRTLDFFDKTLK